MDDQKNGFQSILSLPALLLALGISGGLIWTSVRLSSPRPDLPGAPEETLRRSQEIEARLWQDPLGAIQRGSKESTSPPPAKTLGELESQFSERESSVQGRQVAREGFKVLMMMIPSSNYPEDVEVRLRMRHAVVSALSAAHYSPEDASHLGSLRLRCSGSAPPLGEIDEASALECLAGSRPGQASDGNAILGTTISVPFEWFRQSPILTGVENTKIPAEAPEHVLVLWVRDCFFHDAPLRRLAQLVAGLRQNWARGRKSPVEFCVFGPLDSEVLRSMLEPQELKSNSKTTALVGVKMYSWIATAKDEFLPPPEAGARAPERSPPREAIARHLKEQTGLEFINTISTDAELCSELAEELKLRGVDLTDPRKHVLLLSEWDTFYGRVLPLTFAAEVRNRQLQASANGQPRSELIQGERPSNLHFYTYLRGIDGKLPGAKPDEKEEKKRADQESGPKQGPEEMKRELNRAEGPNQLDYIPRLALQFEALEKRLHQGDPSSGDQGEIAAIGVLGSDFYDKLLVLQALRLHFPNAVFFTTDLDARFLDPEFQRWTRNLLVASGFGLTLNRNLQGDIPPFRANAQTALFLACLDAFNFKGINQWTMPPPPRMFEIGRNRPFNLSVLPDPNGFHPPLRRLGFHIRLPALIPPIIILICAVFLLAHVMASLRRGPKREMPWESPPTDQGEPPTSRTLRVMEMVAIQNVCTGPPCPETQSATEIVNRIEIQETIDARQRSFWVLGSPLFTAAGWFFGLSLCAATLGWVILQSHTDPRGEPFSLFEGISGWPCVILRTTALAVGLLFLWKARGDLRRNELSLSERFGLSQRQSGRNLPGYPGLTKGRLEGGFAVAKWWARNLCISTWEPSSAAPVNAIELWSQYLLRSRTGARLFRILPLVLVYLFLCMAIFKLGGAEPFEPMRGPQYRAFSSCLLMFTVSAFLLLNFSVADAVLLARKFMLHLTAAPTRWPEKALKFARLSTGVANPEFLREWLDIRFAAQFTQRIAGLIYYPSIVFTLLIIARTSYFDDWSCSPALMVIFGLNAAWPVYSAFLLQSAASQAREEALEALALKISAARLEQAPEDISALERLCEEIRSTREGAFTRYLDNPTLRALLLPSTTLGITSLVDFITVK